MLLQGGEVVFVQYPQVLDGVKLGSPLLISGSLGHLECFLDEDLHVKALLLQGVLELVVGDEFHGLRQELL